MEKILRLVILRIEDREISKKRSLAILSLFEQRRVFVISFETFTKRLDIIKSAYQHLHTATQALVSQNPFIEDGFGVAASWLMNLIYTHLETLFGAVNEKALTAKGSDGAYVIKDFIDYYMEKPFGGYIEDNSGHKWRLERNEELYDYIKNGIL